MTRAKSRGERFKAEVSDGNELRPDERILLDEIARVIDVLDLPDLSLAEQRQQQVVLSRMLGQLGMTDENVPRALSPESVRGKRAAEARWSRERAKKAAGE